MPTALGRAREPSQAETSARRGPAESAPADTELLLDHVAFLPPAERPRADRRGPMRPAALSPTRSRLTGWMLGAIFRAADVAALSALALAAAPLAAGQIAPASLTPFIVGALALVWS